MSSRPAHPLPPLRRSGLRAFIHRRLSAGRTLRMTERLLGNAPLSRDIGLPTAVPRPRRGDHPGWPRPRAPRR